VQVGVVTHDHPNGGEWDELLRVRQEVSSEDVAVGQKVRRPEEGPAQGLDPLEVVVERQLEDVFASR